jgi:gliding motility-associated-like protein
MTLAINHCIINKFKHVFLLAACLFPLLLHGANITGVSPTANSISVVASSNITVTFDSVVPTADINTTTFIITGSQTGRVAGSFTGGGTNTITFNPTNDFKAGEIISVTLTTGLGLTTRYGWQFTVASSPVTADFTTAVAITSSAHGARSVYAADVDGDGDIDLLSASFFSGEIAWYENVGSDLFTPHSITTSLVGACAVHAADVDSDGDMDVLSASNNDDKIAWYENNGAENFTPHIITTAAAGAVSVYAADVDGDGDMDVLSAATNDNKIAWYENNGSSVFTPHTITTSAATVYSVYAADVDGDGDIDVLSASAGDHKIAWYENNGAQVFTTRVITTAATLANSVYAGDVDGDGDMDVLSASAGDGEISWYENNGLQVFTRRTIATTADGARSVYMADMDGDGDMDVMSASSLDDRIAWYENNGAQVFTTHIFASASGAYAVHAADVDADGDLDILSASMTDRKIGWYKNDTPPVITPTAAVLTVTPQANALAVSASSNVTITFDNPIPELAVNNANFKINGTHTGNIPGTFTGGGTSTITFDPVQNFKAGEVITVTVTPGVGLAHGYVWKFTVASAAVVPSFVNIPPVTTSAFIAYRAFSIDVDGDGDLDLISCSIGDNKINWYENTGTPTLTAHSVGTTSVPSSICPTDLDDDGDIDVVSTSDTGNLVWFENNGSELFTPRTIPTTNGFFVYVADIDGDGDKDIVSAGFVKVTLHVNDGSENFAAVSITTNMQGRSEILAVDMDRDGDLDIVVGSDEDRKVVWYENDHSLVFSPHVIITGQAQARGIYATDMDGDGDMDIISRVWEYWELNWYENNGAQIFTRRPIATNYPDGEAVHAADFDGDGDMDVMYSSLAAKTIYWNENNGSGVFVNQRVVGTGVDGAMMLSAADMDGDGDMDAISASLNDHEIAWFANNLPPVIAGAVADQTIDENSTIISFAAITVNDRDTGQKLSVSVQLDIAAAGTFTAASLAASGFISAGSGNYTFTGTAETAQEALRLLEFEPTTGRLTAGSSETVRLTIKANDGISPIVTNNITTVRVTNIDPGAPINNAPSFTKGIDLEVNEDAPLQNLTGWATNISAGPPGESSQTVVFLLSNNNAALFSAQPAIDATGTLSFKSTGNASGTATVTVVLKDNGGTANGGVDQSTPITFIITVNSVNDAPSFTKGIDLEVNEDAPSQNLTGWATSVSAGPADESSQTVVFLLSNNNTALFSTQPAIDAAGKLTFKSTADASGTAIVTVVLKDNGGTANGGADQSAPLTFIITVSPVNDVPSFTKGVDLEVNEDAPIQTLTGWAANISSGPSSESSQAVFFLLSNTNTTLFTAQPAIDATGKLTFKSAADASGTATVTVVLKDDGGTANGGVDQSGPITFIVTVNPVNDAPLADPLEDITLNGGAPMELALTGLHPGPGEDNQALTVTASSDVPSLLPNPSVTLNGDGTATLLLQPTANASGTVTITIVIHDDGGTARGGDDETVIAFALTLEQEVALQSVFLPTLFSPNGDEANDALRVRAVGVAEIRFSVYSADGHEVFRTTNVIEATEKGWDGRYHGRDMPTGTYTWTLQGHFTDGTPLTFGKHTYGQTVLLR